VKANTKIVMLGCDLTFLVSRTFAVLGLDFRTLGHYCEIANSCSVIVLDLLLVQEYCKNLVEIFWSLFEVVFARRKGTNLIWTSLLKMQQLEVVELPALTAR
jgi:hypothetical protein